MADEQVGAERARRPQVRDTPLAYSHALGDDSPPAICGVTPGIVGALLSGTAPGPPLSKNQSNTERIACAVGTSVVVPGPLMLAPR